MIPVSLHLAIRQWRARALRPILCTLAIAAAVAMVVCVGAGFDSARATITQTVNNMLGTADIHVRSAARPPANQVPARLLESLRRRPEVARAAGRLQAQLAIAVVPADSSTAPAAPAAAEPVLKWFYTIGIDPHNDDHLRPKHYVAGHGLDGTAGQIVLDQSVAREVRAHLGDTIRVGNGQALHPATVVGILEGPAIELVQKATVLVRDQDLAQDLGTPLEYSVIDLELQHGVDLQAYAKTLQEQLGKTLSVVPATEGAAKMERETRPLDFALLILSVVSGICAALIIGTTLSVGVQERIRQFGQLRCLGAARGQLVQMLLADALLLMLSGTALGMVAGWGISHLLVWRLPNVFLAYHLSAWSLLTAAGNGLIATVLGSLIPAWQVWRISPMQAVATMGHAVRVRQVWVAGAVGAMALLVQVALWQIPQRDVRLWTYLIVGIPLVFTGYALLGPAILVVLERVAYRVLAAALGLRAPLLRQAWSRTPWRAGAMIAALMIGITLFTTVRERGRQLITAGSFQQEFPDLMLYRIFGTPPDAVRIMGGKIPEIAALSPVAAFPVRFRKAPFRLGPLLPEDSTLFVASDPANFRQLIKLEFLQGDPDRAYAQLEAGNAVFVSREYQAARGIGVGDTITLETAAGQAVDFTVAGVVRSPGMDIAKHYFDVGAAFRDKAVNSVMGSTADARKYFGQDRVNLAMANVRPGANVPAVRNAIERFGWQTASAVEMKERIALVVQRFVDALSVLALAAMGIASLGVANMVIASVYARRYEFGILRAIGAGRGQLLRLVLAEASLIALTAGALGAITGLHYAFMAARVDRLFLGFNTDFLAWYMAWRPLLCGVAITLPLAWLAALVPAWRGASTAQQVLLAGGRA